MQIGIIGAGMAGLAAADQLVGQGHQVTLFDKGRAPGGRLSTRRTEDGLWQFDHGAPWFVASDEHFIAAMTDWEQQGVVARWPEERGNRWVGVPGMNALVHHVLQGHDARFGVQITSLLRSGDGWWLHDGEQAYGPYDTVVLAMPAEQSAVLAGMHDFDMARAAASVISAPVWTGLYGFDCRIDAPDVVMARGGVELALRNAAKPGRHGETPERGSETWVVHATSSWSSRHLELEREVVAEMLLAELAGLLGEPLPTPVVMQAHRWRFACPSEGRTAVERCLWNPQIRLGACGDWLGGSGVETAWLSGRALAANMLKGSMSEGPISEGWRGGA